MNAFGTPLTIHGPLRGPRQLLAEQSIDGLTSVHDDATAAALRLTGAPIEGPTHFSQFDPLAYAVWGTAWFERGCISSHFHTPEPSEHPFRARVRLDGSTFDIFVVGSDVSVTSNSDGAADLGVDLSVENLVAARRGEPLRVPPGPASKRFARLFRFETLDAAGAGAVR
jgi:hypothetical protein